MKTSTHGLTDEQRQLFDLGHCRGDQQHRWTGPNFPTPEGDCPYCIDPLVAVAFQQLQIQALERILSTHGEA